MDKLPPRQETILGLVIREYIDTVIPVSSKALVDKYNLGFSTATARNCRTVSCGEAATSSGTSEGTTSN